MCVYDPFVPSLYDKEVNCGNSWELEVNFHGRHHCFVMELEICGDPMYLNFDALEWVFGITELEWTCKVNTPTVKSISEWENSLSVWMREYLK